MSNIGDDHGDDELSKAMQLNVGSVLHMVLRAAIELDLFEIMAKSGNTTSTSTNIGAQKLWSSYEIASHLPTRNPDPPVMLERMLRFLASNSILTCTIVTDENGKNKTLYGLAPICKCYVRDQDGISLAPSFLCLQDKVVLDSWYHLKDAIIEGGIPFNKAHGMHVFEYTAIDNRFNEVFNKAMLNFTTLIMKKVLETYNGFEDIRQVVDVGGGFGQTLATVISKYPHIKGINFDLPHVIKDASPIAGVQHVGGDMFENVPKGEVIFLKSILHDWGDEHCLKLLKNCWKALPDSGKVIVVEEIMTEYSKGDVKSTNVSIGDMMMLTLNPGGKERTQREFEALAIGARFAASKLVCRASAFAVIEFHKKM